MQKKRNHHRILFITMPLIFSMAGACVMGCRHAPSNEQHSINTDTLTHPKTRQDNTKVAKDTSLNVQQDQ